MIGWQRQGQKMKRPWLKHEVWRSLKLENRKMGCEEKGMKIEALKNGILATLGLRNF